LEARLSDMSELLPRPSFPGWKRRLAYGLVTDLNPEASA